MRLVSSSPKPSFSKAQCTWLAGLRSLTCGTKIPSMPHLYIFIEYYCVHYLYSPYTYLDKIYNDLENSSHYTADNKARRENASDDVNHRRRVDGKSWLTETLISRTRKPRGYVTSPLPGQRVPPEDVVPEKQTKGTEKIMRSIATNPICPNNATSPIVSPSNQDRHSSVPWTQIWRV